MIFICRILIRLFVRPNFIKLLRIKINEKFQYLTLNRNQLRSIDSLKQSTKLRFIKLKKSNDTGCR